MAKPDVFARRLRELAEAVEPRAAQAKAGVAARAGKNVVRNTPVDTAKARSEWVASGGRPDLAERGIRSRADTVSDIETAVATIPAETDIHIANGGEKVPYLGRLDAGSSTQAPAGFVREAALEGLKALRNFRVLRRIRGTRG